MNEKYYTTLGVSRNASAAELRSAFRKLAHRYHPDVSSEPNAAEKFIEVVKAYRAITTAQTRSLLQSRTHPGRTSDEYYDSKTAPQRWPSNGNRTGSRIDMRI